MSTAFSPSLRAQRSNPESKDWIATSATPPRNDDQTYSEQLESLMNAILSNDPHTASALCRDKEKFAANVQLAIYTEGYRLRLIGVLQDAFPALQYLLGAQKFRALAQAYVEATPSRHFNIDKYPIGFAHYIAQTAEKEFAGELAKLEEAIHEVYQMEESPPLTQSWAASQTQETLATAILLPRTASRLLAFAYPLNDYLQDFRDGKKPTPPAPAQTYLLVLRHRNQVQRLTLEAGEYLLLSLLARGTPFAATLEDERFTEDDAQSIMGWLARWVNEGCLRMPA